MAETILIVEDEASLRETLAYNLSRQGYGIHDVTDGQSGVEAARRYQPDLIILDLMLPIIDGLEVCRLLRQEMSTPILMLTARQSEIDRVLGLEMGADDYLTKPFSMRELIARVKALLRRVQLDRRASEERNGAAPKAKLIFSDLTVDVERHEASLNEMPLVMKPKEYDLLLFFVQHEGRVLSRELILDRVWGWDFNGGSRTVDVHVRWLRQKIEAAPASPQRIVTVRGVGYRFDG